MQDKIVIHGARAHNLKKILTWKFHGTSWCGDGVCQVRESPVWPLIPSMQRVKRRYVESLSAYARQFLGKYGKARCGCH